VIDLEPKGDKFSRALSAAIRLGNKTTYFLHGAHWLSDFETELLHFPNVKYDDQVDTLSQADYMLTDMKIQNRFACSVDNFHLSSIATTRFRG
jgi:predicted phage terminase large subunit-like protein